MRWLLAVLLLSGCVVIPEATDRSARILAMGDSILAWNRGQGAGVTDAVEQQLGEPVVDASVAGAKMRQDGFRASFGFSIPDQLRVGDWDAIILNGGGNDLFQACGCNQCDATLDRLVQKDYPALLDRLGDAKVFILGYYGRAGDRPGAFDACEDDLKVLENRLTRLAAERPSVQVVPIRAVITGQPARYDSDRIHPSREGSAAIGALLSQAISSTLLATAP